MLIQAERLANGASIFQDAAITRGEYFHIEVAGHDILLAEGVPAESYLDTGNRANFSNNKEFISLYPDFAPQHCRTLPALAEAGPRLTALKQRLLALAKADGFTLTADPGLRLIAGGKLIMPDRAVGEHFTFTLPVAVPRSVWSRAAGPGRARSRLRGFPPPGRVPPPSRTRRRRAQPRDAGFGDGWYGPERDGPNYFRWTNGNARCRRRQADRDRTRRRAEFLGTPAA